MSDAARMYRCYNCPPAPNSGATAFEFMHPVGKPVACPSCGIKDGDRGSHLLVLLDVIHFDAPAKAAEGTARATAANATGASLAMAFGTGHAACDPAKVTAGGGMFTGAPEAVTCPQCRASEAFRRAADRGGINPRFDVPAQITAAGEVRLIGLPADAEADLSSAAEASAALRR